MPTVGAYERISEDPNDTRLGVQRQREDTETLARLRGWTVHRHYTDNDLSAYKRKVVRPEFEQLLADLNAGVIDGIVAYDLDRLVRQPRDLERAIELYEQSGRVFATVQGDLDLSTPDGITMARVMVAFANKSSMDTARRVKRTHLSLAMSGAPVGGTRPFGWLADRKTLDPKEAALVREAARKLLAGSAVHGIVRDWQQRCVLTPHGNQWQTGPFRTMMRSPRLAGWRVYQGRVLRGEDDQPVQGLWTPILTVEVWEQVAARLARQPGEPRRGAGAKYLLSGLIRCALCGKAMRGNAHNRYSTFTYACASPTNGGCGKVAIAGGKTDMFISDLYMRHTQHVTFDSERRPWPGADGLNGLIARRAAMYEALESGLIAGDGAWPRIGRYDQQIIAARQAEQDWLRAQPAVAACDSSQFMSGTVEGRRLALSVVFEQVLVRPSSARGGAWNPERLVPVWRD